MEDKQDPVCTCDIKSQQISNRHQTFCKLYYPAFQTFSPPWNPYLSVPKHLQHLLEEPEKINGALNNGR